MRESLARIENAGTTPPVGTSDRYDDTISSGTVDLALVEAVLDNIHADPSVVLASLGPGPCRSAADGIDKRLGVWLVGLDVDSCEADLFNGDHPLIVAARNLGQAAAAAAPVDFDEVVGG